MSGNRKRIRLGVLLAFFIGAFLSVFTLIGGDGTDAWFKSDSQSNATYFSAAPVFPEFRISGVTAVPECSSALVTWTTNKPGSSIVEWSQTGGGPYATNSDPALVTYHSYLITDIAYDTIWYFRVSSVSADGTNASSDEFDFSSLSGGKPTLSLWKTGTFWDSYEEYLNHILTVGFRIENAGPDALNPMIAGIINTNGVITYSASTINDIPTGYNSPFTVKYLTPIGVTRFDTQIFINVSDACGDMHSYPGPYPGS